MADIDERVVEMKFNNAQFEAGTKQSMSTLDKLKSSLNLDGAARSLQGLQDVADKFHLGGLADAVEGIASKFTALGVVGVTALSNITNRAVNAGLALGKSLVIDPITQGYGDYQTKLTSVQTIMNSTGKSLKYVNKYFDQLDEYADKTIYNLTDMTSAAAKFTNAGVGLDKAVPAIKGIANMVALAGQDSNAASIAFYNLSQSIAGGFLTTMDYKSLSLQNVATKEWRDNMIKTAVQMGELKKTGKDLYQIPGSDKAINSQKLFTEELSTGWASTRVLLKTLGEYGDTNTKIGKKAQAAAQDVKSFGMMMETLRAQVGTGWTDTYEILLGNVLQSKKLFTPLTTELSNVITNITDMRNNLLQEWKKEGGRDAAIQSVVNAYGALKTIIIAVMKAYKAIFPPASGKQLATITDNVKTFTYMLGVLAREYAPQITRTFKGFFALLDIGRFIFVELVKMLFSLFGELGPGSAGILDITANMGDFLVMIHDVIVNGNGVTDFFKLLGGILRVPIVLISRLIGFLGDLARGLGDIRMAAFGEDSKKAGQKLTVLERIMRALDKATEVIKERFDAFKKSLGPGFAKAGDVVGDFAENFAKNLENINWDTVLTAMKAGFFGSLGLLFTSFFGGNVLTSIKDLVSGQSEMGLFARLFKGFDIGGGVFKQIKEGLGGVTDSLKAMQRNLQSKTLLNIAFAMGILTISMVLLSMIPAERLAGATGAMIAMFTALGVSMKTISTIASSKDVAKIPLLALGLILLSIAVSILAGAVVKLGQLSWDQMLVGMGALAGILAGVVGMAKLLTEKDQANLIKTGLAMIPFAVGIRIMASALVAMQGLDIAEVGISLAGIGGILGMLIVYSKLMAKNEKSIIKGAFSLLIISVGLRILVGVLASLAAQDPLKMGIALVLMAGALFAIAGALKIMPKNMAVSGLALLLIASALKIMAKVLSDFAGMGIGEVIQSLIVLGITLAIVAGAMYLMSGALPGAAALLVAAAAIYVMVPALQALGSMDIEAIWKALGILSLGLLIIAGSLYLMSGALPGAAALVVAAFALTLLAPALAILGAIPIAQIGVALLALFGVFVVLGVGAAALAVLAPVLFILGAAIFLIGVGAGAAGAGVFLLATGLILLGGAGAAGIATLTLAILAVLKLIPSIAKALAEGFIAFVEGIADSLGSIIDAVVKILDMVLAAIAKEAPKIIKLGIKLISEFLDAMVILLPKVVDTGLKILTGFLKGIADNIPKIAHQATRIITRFLGAIGDEFPKIVDAGAKMIVKILNGIADGIEKNSEAIGRAGGRVATAIIRGMIKGVTAGLRDVVGAILDMGGAALTAIKLVLGIHSPSKEFQKIGEYTVDGFVLGITSKKEDVADAFNSLRTQLTDFIEQSKKDVDDFTDKVADLKGTQKQDTKDVDAQQKVYNQALRDRRKGTSKTIRDEKRKLTDLTDTRKKDTRELRDAIAASKDGDATAKQRKSAQDRVEDLTKKRKKDTREIKAQRKVLNAAIKDNKTGVVVEEARLKLDKLKRGQNRTNKDLLESQTALDNAIAEGPKAELALKVLNDEEAKYKTRLEEIATGTADYTDKIEKAETALENAKQTLSDFNNTLKDQYSTLEDISKDTVLTEYTTNLEDQITKVNEFAEKIQAARALGLNDTSYEQILKKGPDAIPFLDQLLAQGQGGVADLNSLVSQVQSASASLATTASESLYRSGVNTAQGYLDGLKSDKQALVDEGVSISNAITAAVNKALGIKSPSRVFRKIGQYTMDGFKQGIRDTGASVQAAAVDVADDTVSSLRDTMSNLGDSISLGIDSAPVVRPVLDLTQVQKDAGLIDGMLGTPGVSVDTTFNAAKAASNGYDDNQQAIMAAKSEVATNNTTIFNQTNNSPKSLSNAEIYRQTNNQLSKLKRGDNS